jgi:hypothetical protein
VLGQLGMLAVIDADVAIDTEDVGRGGTQCRLCQCGSSGPVAVDRRLWRLPALGGSGAAG